MEHSLTKLPSVLEVTGLFNQQRWHCTNKNQHMVVKLTLGVSEDPGVPDGVRALGKAMGLGC